jgi:diketogulonate reductase-like aldo/keto reductase
MAAQIPSVTLQNGVVMPQAGLGVWQAEEGDEVAQAVGAALEAGYRLIDTAAAYGNEAGVGKAIRDSNVPREDIFVTTKLWNTDQGYEAALKAFDDSLSKLGMDYVDLYLIHWPQPKTGNIPDTWKAFEKLYEDKRTRAIGVANFLPHHLEPLLAECHVPPMVDQIQLHPRLPQLDTRRYCETHDIIVESYSPLMRAKKLLQEPVITDLAEKYGRDPAQIVLRWHVQHGLVVIPKSVTPERIRSNINIFDFEISANDMRVIDGMETGEHVVPDPDEFEDQ